MELYNVYKSHIGKNSFSYYILDKFCFWASIASSQFNSPNFHQSSREVPPFLGFFNSCIIKTIDFSTTNKLSIFRARLEARALLEGAPYSLIQFIFFMQSTHIKCLTLGNQADFCCHEMYYSQGMKIFYSQFPLLTQIFFPNENYLIF